MTDGPVRVAVRLDPGPGADGQELDELTTRLRRQLLELDVRSVDRPRAGEAPPGTRAAELVALGGLLITLATPEVLKAVVGLVQSWVATRQGRSVELRIGEDTLTVTGVSSDEQRRLVELFVARHAG
jgi:hypothetical protein